MTVLAASSAETALAFIEFGLVALGLSVLARLAGRLGLTAVPLYLVAGLVFGEGGVLSIRLTEDFITLAGEIGVLLLLLTLGLEYSTEELREGLRGGLRPGVVDAALNAGPGFVAGVLLGWSVPASILLGGVTWISSSGVISKVLSDLDRLGNRETPSILNLLVIEDLAMAVYLPVVAAIVVGDDPAATAGTVAIALVAVGVVLFAAMQWGDHLSGLLAGASDESLLLSVFGLTLVVGGLAQEVQVSAAVGAFLVGLALSGSVQHRSMALMAPLRDLFAAVFFVSFAFAIDPADLPPVLLPAVALFVVTAGTKLVSGWVGAARNGVAARGRLRAGTALIARGEFSIVIAALGASLAEGSDLASLAAAYVLLTAVAGPLATKFAHRIPIPQALTLRAQQPAVNREGRSAQ